MYQFFMLINLLLTIVPKIPTPTAGGTSKG